MKLRAFVAVVILGGVSAAAASCGSTDGSNFDDGSGGDAGSSGSITPPGFVTPGGEGGPSNPSSGCVKLTCADLKINCGPAGDGCGGVITDCGQCAAPETCGGGGTASVCGGASGCQKKACADLGIECGQSGDGCGGAISCPTCPSPTFCGGGGPSKCGGGQVGDGGVINSDGGTCTPRTVCVAGECGPVADGCGSLLTCPGCPTGLSCGGGGTPSMCGAPACTKTTCLAHNANCGFIADGCGGILDCGGPNACQVAGEFCGGGGPSRCGNGLDGGTPPTCTNLCLDQPTDCSGPSTPNTTAISGTVYMPNGTMPVYDALVYVPNGTPSPVPVGVGSSCDTCEAQASGAPLINTHTDASGRFTLSNMPYRAAGVPLVIQKGRWRKQITVMPTRCQPKELSATYPQTAAVNNTTFGRTQSATNNIPKYAVTSGEKDSLQCLLRKIGIADSEFKQPADNGRVTLYSGAGGTTRYNDNFNGYRNGARDLPLETALYGNGAVGTVDTSQLVKYDAIVLSCTGGNEVPMQGLGGYSAEIKAYADAGGKIFGSHWHHWWLETGASPWGTAGGVAGGKLATIDHQNDLVNPVTAFINTAATFAKGNALADWLVQTHVLDGTTGSPRGRLRIGSGGGGDDGAQHTVDAVDTSRVNSWISIPPPITEFGGGSTTNNPSIQYFDFNTPVGQATQCGRFVISDLHVATAPDNTANFPNSNCGTDNPPWTTFTDQERVLAFMLFDLTSCIQPVTPPPPPVCLPLSCAQQGVACGLAGDGCGNQQTCAACAQNQVCQGNPPACLTPACVPLTCQTAAAECGKISNGCGGTVDCPPCPTGTCGGNGPNKCGSSSCTPTTCVAQGIHCGPAGDGCGGPLDCGPCPQGQTCGGGGVPYTCGAPNCTPRTCSQANASCGFIADGCGALVDCGPCPTGQVCGGNGIANQCGGGGVH